MSLNGKTANFQPEGYRAVAATAGLEQGRWKRILSEVREMVRGWRGSAEQAKVNEEWATPIEVELRV